jgi:hypothetical protein
VDKNKLDRLGMLAAACKFQPLRRKSSRELHFKVNQGKKLVRPYLNKLARHGGHSSNPSYSEGMGRRIKVQDQLQAKKQETMCQKSLEQ